MTASTDADDVTETHRPDEEERSADLKKRLDELAKEVAPKKPAGDDTWKGDVA